MAKFRQPPNSAAEATIVSKSITANGTYNASADSADGYNPVTVAVPEKTIVSKSIAANGTYNASADSADGYNPVTVNVDHIGVIYAGTSTPSNSLGENNDIYIQYEYNQSFPYDYKIIAEYRKISGVWVTYYDSGIYLPYTDAKNIICEAYPDNFDALESTWGDGSNPINFSGSPSYNSGEGAVSIPTASNGVLAYCDLGANDSPFTAYIVMKGVEMSQYSRLLSAMAIRESAQGILLYGNPVTVSSWGSDSSIGITASNYFVGVIQYSGSGYALGGAYGASLVNKSPSHCGRYVTIGRTDIDPSTTNAEPCDTLVKYIGIVSGIDSTSAINNNLSHLYNTFIV